MLIDPLSGLEWRKTFSCFYEMAEEWQIPGKDRKES